MKKILVIAAREYRAIVGTKAFVVSIVMMPLLMVASIIAMSVLRNVGEVKERKIAVIDHIGDFGAVIKANADARNAAMDALAKQEAESADGSATPARDDGFLGNGKEKYLIELIDAKDISDETRFELSERIRNRDLYAFLEIPTGSDVVDPGKQAESARFFSQDSSLSEARMWLATVISNAAQEKRLRNADIDPAIVNTASKRIDVVGMGLVERLEDGSIGVQEGASVMGAIFLPMGVMMLMFIVIFMAAQPMLESVLEEKSQRIAEVLLGSVNPFQLMCGKLLGTVAGSLTAFLVYLLGAFFFASNQGYTEMIPFELAPWFVVFQIVGVLFYASIFLAIGASVSQLKEAQAMLLPVWMMMMSPMFVWLFIVRDPLGRVATYFSFFPPAAPTAMMLRLSTGQTIPIWQPILSFSLTIIATFAMVVIASRIFRVGLLWQGKTPKLGEILKWAVTG